MEASGDLEWSVHMLNLLDGQVLVLEIALTGEDVVMCSGAPQLEGRAMCPRGWRAVGLRLQVETLVVTVQTARMALRSLVEEWPGRMGRKLLGGLGMSPRRAQMIVALAYLPLATVTLARRSAASIVCKRRRRRMTYMKWVGLSLRRALWLLCPGTIMMLLGMGTSIFLALRMKISHPVSLCGLLLPIAQSRNRKRSSAVFPETPSFIIGQAQPEVH